MHRMPHAGRARRAAARGVRGDEFHQHRAGRRRIASGRSAAPCGKHLADFVVIGVLLEKEIDEPGARDLDLGDVSVGRQSGHQPLGNFRGFCRVAFASCMRDDCWQSRRAAHRACARSRWRGCAGPRGTVVGQGGEGAAQQIVDQCLQDRIQVLQVLGGAIGGIRGAPPWRGSLHACGPAGISPPPADPRRWTSADRGGPGSVSTCASKVQETAAASIAPTPRSKGARENDRRGGRSGPPRDPGS